MNMSVLRMCFVMIALLALARTVLADASKTNRYMAYPSSRPSSFSLCRDLADDWPSPFTNSVCWSDGFEPHAGATYVAGKIDGANSILWTPIKDEDTTYAMFDTLVLEAGTSFCIRHKSKCKAIFNDLRVDGDMTFYCPNVNQTILGGKLRLSDGVKLTVSSYNSRSFHIESEISGGSGGQISFITQSATTAYRSYYQLSGANTNFLGKISVSTRGDAPTFTSQYSSLSINAADALGGKLSEFAYDALTLKNKSLLDVGNHNIVLPADANRGILISSGGGRIDVSEGGTFTVNWPLVLWKNTHFYKEGTGRLVLGKPLEFMNRSDKYIGTTPGTIDSNNLYYYIDVRHGTLAVTDSQALNGACVAFSNDTALVVSVDVANEALKKYGVRGDKTRYGTPFTTDVPIRLVADGTLTEGTYSVPLVTVKNGYIDDVASKLKVTLDIDGYRLDGITSTAADGISGATTFYANLLHNGLVISVR